VNIMSIASLNGSGESLESGPNYRVPALEKGLDLLECLAGQGVPMTQSQLARQLERGPNEIFRTLMTLERRGYIQRDAESGAYSLTLRLFELSHTHSPYEELLRAASRPMREFVNAMRESCHLSVINNSRLLVLAQEENPALVRMSIAIGGVFSLLHTASGRLLLAYLEPEQLEETLQVIKEYAAWTTAQRTAFAQKLKKINELGFEYIYEETNFGVHDLAVLVGSQSSQTRAALTATGLSPSAKTFVETILPSLRRCANSIGLRAGIIA
jgi:DNA-binding IclR family transcriptional regulator